jgi:WD40 repeat protein
MERQQQASATSLSSLVSSSSKPSSTGPPLTSSVGSAVNAVSFSPNYQQIVVAGREVLKIVDAKTFEEVMPIRVGKVNLNYSSNDVKWNPFEQQKHWLASAATNGMVVIWNLENKGKKIGS